MTTYLNVARYHLVQRFNYLVLPWAILVFVFGVSFGTFVAEDVLDYTVGPRTRFTEWIHRHNKEPSGRVLQRREIAADATIAGALGIRAASDDGQSAGGGPSIPSARLLSSGRALVHRVFLGLRLQAADVHSASLPLPGAGPGR